MKNASKCSFLELLHTANFIPCRIKLAICVNGILLTLYGKVGCLQQITHPWIYIVLVEVCCFPQGCKNVHRKLDSSGDVQNCVIFTKRVTRSTAAQRYFATATVQTTINPCQEDCWWTWLNANQESIYYIFFHVTSINTFKYSPKLNTWTICLFWGLDKNRDRWKPWQDYITFGNQQSES